MSLKTHLPILAACALTLLTALPATAVDREWANVGAGLNNWNEPGNWNPNDDFVKTGDNALFNQDASYIVIVQAPSEARNVTFTAGEVTLGGGTLDSDGIVTIDNPLATMLSEGPQLTVSGPTWDNVGDAVVADAGFGSFTLNSLGSFRSEDLFIGNQAGSVGMVTVDGPGALLQTDGLNSGNGFYIGNSGTGTLNVTGGGQARIVNDVTGGIADFLIGAAVDGEGTLNIAGAGSEVIAEDVLIGNFGSGHLNITAGAVLNQNIHTSPDAFVAQQAGSSGDVTVNGDGSQWLMARLEIGNSGDATLSVEAGGLVRSNSNDMTLGDAGGSGRVAVFGAGVANSTLDVTNDLYIGNLGLGQLFVGQDLVGTADGNGTLDVGSDLLIGSAPSNNMDNKAVVSGTNAIAMVQGNLIAGGTIEGGAAGTGTFEARNGATISVGGAVVAGGGPDSEGTVVIDGLGTTLQANSLFIGNANAGADATGVMTVSDQAMVTITGPSNGVVTLADDTNSTGTLTVTGAGSRVESTGGTAEWWIGGSSNADGIGGNGILNVLDGGQVVMTGRAVLGYKGTATGEVTVDGSGSQLDANGDLVLVGFAGVGNMDVTGGGIVNANGMFVGDAAGSAGSQLDIDGAGSVVNLTGQLHVGDSSRGIVNVTGGGQLNVATANNANRLIIGDESPTDASRLTVSGTGSRVDYFGTDRVSVGFVGGGSFSDPVILEVLGGAVFQMEHTGVNTSVGLFVADEANSAGLVTVDGNGSLLHTRAMYVSDSTSTRGTVEITGGGVMEVDEFVEIGSAGDGDGFLTVSGPGSRLDVGGDLSAAAGASNLRVDGTITITNGGTVTNGDQGFIGRATTNVGTVSVGGAGALATWDVGTDLFIAGNDSLSVGGSQISGSGTLDIDANGLVTVGGTLVLKDRGTIHLDGGEVAADAFLFQDFAERTGVPTVNFNSGTFRYTNPTGTTLDAASLGTILGGSATLASGQHLAVDGLTVLGGPLRLNGGRLSVGAISAGNFANVDFDAGTFALTNSNLSVASGGLFGTTMVLDSQQAVEITGAGRTTSVAAGASLNVIGGGFRTPSATNEGLVIISQTTDVDFDSDNIGDGLVNNGQLVLVDATIGGAVTGGGAIEIVGTAGVGALSLAAGGSIGFDLAGTSLGQFDTLTVAGTANLAGTLAIDLASGYTPTPGDSFEVLTAGSLIDSGIVLAGDSAGFSLLATATSLLLQFEPSALDGDFNFDGTVNLADYTVWRDNLGGLYTQSDYVVWKSNFGLSAASAAASNAVPEPTGIYLLAAFSLCCIARRYFPLRWRSSWT